MKKARDLNKGDAPTLIMAVLNRGASHGYAIARAIEQQSGQTLQIGEGALYPMLRALEEDGYVAAAWDTSNGGPARKVYSLTDSGRCELTRRVADWNRFRRAIEDVIGGRQDAEAV